MAKELIIQDPIETVNDSGVMTSVHRKFKKSKYMIEWHAEIGCLHTKNVLVLYARLSHCLCLFEALDDIDWYNMEWSWCWGSTPSLAVVLLHVVICITFKELWLPIEYNIVLNLTLELIKGTSVCIGVYTPRSWVCPYME